MSNDKGHIRLPFLHLHATAGVDRDELYLTHGLVLQKVHLHSKNVRIERTVLRLRIRFGFGHDILCAILADKLRKVEVSDAADTEVVHAGLMGVPQGELFGGERGVGGESASRHDIVAYLVVYGHGS